MAAQVDLNKLSDEQLLQLEKGLQAKVQAKPKQDDLSKLSDQELLDLEKKLQGEVTPLRAARIGIEKGVSFGARPAIAGAGAFAGAGKAEFERRTELPLLPRIQAAIGAGKEAFGQAREEAISEQRRAQKDQPGISAASEIGGAFLTAPLTPVRGIVGGAKLGAAAGLGQAAGEAESLEEAAGLVGAGAALGGAVPAAFKLGGKALKPIKDKVSKATTKIQSTLTGVPEKSIETFKKQNAQVERLIKEFPTTEGVAQDAVDQARAQISSRIQDTRKTINAGISQALTEASPEKNISLNPVLEKLQKVRSQLDPRLDPNDISEIDELISTVRSVADESGSVNVGELFRIKQHLQDRAKKAYVKQGQIFSPGKKPMRAAKEAAAEARSMLHPLSPAIKDADGKLQELHAIEESINKSLLKEGSASGALLSAGEGLNPRSIRALKRIEDITGFKALDEAERLASARQFADPSILPTGPQTGFAQLRQALGRAGLGAATGFAVEGSPEGALAGAALTSPKALRAFIRAQIKTGNIAKSAEKLLDTPKGRAVLIRALQSQGPAPINGKGE